MKELIILNLKISLAIAIFYLLYKILLSHDTFFVRNRFYLIGSLLTSIITPLLKFQTKVYQNVPDMILTVNPNYYSPTQHVSEVSIWILIIKITIVIYFTGVLLGIVRLLWAYKKVISLIITSKRRKFQELILVITRLSVSPFSFLKWLIIPENKLNQSDFENIVQHESIHSRQYHSVDLFLAELLVAFQWFNPFAWWMKKSIMENHEFIVDKEILRKGVNSRNYQYSLLNISTAGSQLAVVNYFNSNLLKKRILMMNKTQSPKWYGINNGMILVSIALVVALTSSFETKVIAQKSDADPLYLLNGKTSNKEEIQKIKPGNIKTMSVFKDSLVKEKYRKGSEKGVVEVVAKDSITNQNSNKEDEISIVGYGNQKLRRIDTTALILVDGKPSSKNQLNSINPNSINTINVLKGKSAVLEYGEKGKNGVVEIETKK